MVQREKIDCKERKKSNDILKYNILYPGKQIFLRKFCFFYLLYIYYLLIFSVSFLCFEEKNTWPHRDICHRIQKNPKKRKFYYEKLEKKKYINVYAINK